VHPGDEVIVLEPCYDSYVPNIELTGGTVVRVPLTPGSFRPDFDKIAAALSPPDPRHRHQQPAQPQRTIWSPRTCSRLQDLLAPTDVLLISDEVYEHMVFDGRAARKRGALIPAWPRAASSCPASARPIT
jgi:methionine aminotransferase